MAYMMDKFKGLYRLKTPYDQTNQFPRDLKDNYSDHDIYIACQNNIQISHYGRGVLEAYIPSVMRGHNVLKAIYENLIGGVDNYLTVIESTTKAGEIKRNTVFDYESFYKDKKLNKIIYDIQDTDEEVMFKFKIDQMENLAPYLKPKTNGANISPFSTKNLPKSDYKIPDEDLTAYKTITSKLSKEHVLKVGHITKAFISSLGKSKKKKEEIKNDMRQKCVKGKEYIHMTGHWTEYLTYLNKEINTILDTNN